MAILGIYKISLTHSKLGLTKETCANKVIPFLVPLSIENGLSLAQFNAMMSLIKEIVTKVETEHRSKLEQLTSIQKESNTLKHSFDQSFVNVKSPTKTDVDDVFSNLGLESFLNSIDDSSNGTAANGSTGSSSLNLQEKQRFVRCISDVSQ